MYVIFKKVCSYILVLFSFKKLKRIEPNKDNIILKYLHRYFMLEIKKVFQAYTSDVSTTAVD